MTLLMPDSMFASSFTGANPAFVDHCSYQALWANEPVMESRAPRVGHKKSRKGCAQCKRRHVKVRRRISVLCTRSNAIRVVRSHDDTVWD